MNQKTQYYFWRNFFLREVVHQPPMLYAAVIVNLFIIFLLLKSKIKSPPSKNVDRLSMPKNVLPEA
jgi:hypothetical protein